MAAARPAAAPRPSAAQAPLVPHRPRRGVGPGAFSLLALMLAGCSRPDEAPVAYQALDCGQSFDEQAAALVAQPQLVAAPKDPAEPYRFYSSADGRTSYLITLPGAPGHPAIMMQQARGADVVTTGCPYGERAGYDQLHAYLDGLKHWRRK